MTDDCCNGRRDPIKSEADRLTRMLDSGRATEEVAQALREDSYNMTRTDFNKLVRTMSSQDQKQYGDNICTDRDGNVVIDTGRDQLIIATRDWDNRHASRVPRQNDRRDHDYVRHDDRYDRRDDRYERNRDYDYERHGNGRRDNGRDAVTDGVVNGAIGAVVGGAIDGKKGAIAGGLGGVGNVVIERSNRDHGRTDVEDFVVKGAVGAGIGAIVNGKKGAIAGAAGSVGANAIDKIFNRR